RIPLLSRRLPGRVRMLDLHSVTKFRTVRFREHDEQPIGVLPDLSAFLSFIKHRHIPAMYRAPANFFMDHVRDVRLDVIKFGFVPSIPLESFVVGIARHPGTLKKMCST